MLKATDEYITQCFIHSNSNRGFPALCKTITDKETRQTWVREQMTVFLEQTPFFLHQMVQSTCTQISRITL